MFNGFGGTCAWSPQQLIASLPTYLSVLIGVKVSVLTFLIHRRKNRPKCNKLKLSSITYFYRCPLKYRRNVIKIELEK